MEYVQLGGSGLKISRFALGSYQTIGSYLAKPAAQRCVAKALESGINFFDTANVYEDAELVLGELLHSTPRHHFVIATKCFFPIDSGPNSRGLSRKHLVESVNRSLKRLQVDYIDLFQCHRFDSEVPLEETVAALSDLIRAGKILYWGTSRWTDFQLKEAHRIAKAIQGYAPISQQIPYNLINHGLVQEEVSSLVGQIAYYPLAQGVLTGKYCSASTYPLGSRALNENLRNKIYDLSPEVLFKIRKLKLLADKYKISLAQLSLVWLLSQSSIQCVLMGASSPAQIEENIAALGVKLAIEDLMELTNFFKVEGPHGKPHSKLSC